MSREADSAAGAVVLFLFLLLVLAYFVIPWIYAAFVFMSLVITLISLIAWNRPRRFFHLGITPYQARALICFGLVGGVLGPSFMLFAGWLLNVDIPLGLLPHAAFAGYAYGLYQVLEECDFDRGVADLYDAERALELLPPTPPTPALPAPPKKSFDYADWSDAKEL